MCSNFFLWSFSPLHILAVEGKERCLSHSSEGHLLLFRQSATRPCSTLLLGKWIAEERVGFMCDPHDPEHFAQPFSETKRAAMVWHDFCSTCTAMQPLGTEMGVLFALPYRSISFQICHGVFIFLCWLDLSSLASSLFHSSPLIPIWSPFCFESISSSRGNYGFLSLLSL